jgi:protein-tyrosine phosphatase
MSALVHPEAPNFRSLCGMELEEGRRVRARRFYRTASPHTFSPAGMEALEALDPAAVVDFRGRAEAAAASYDLPQGLRERRVHLPVEPKTGDRVRALHAAGRLTEETAREAMRETYKYYVDENAQTFADFLRLAAEAPGRPVIWHCAAGKDRTGFAAMLVLSALGADEEAILRDYLLSNELYEPPKDAISTVPEIARQALRRVEREYLESALEAIAAVHGSPRAFAAEALGGEARRRAFLEEASEPA